MGKGRLRAGERDRAWLKALYWGEVSYHDEQMGKFIEEATKAGVLVATGAGLVGIADSHPGARLEPLLRLARRGRLRLRRHHRARQARGGDDRRR